MTRPEREAPASRSAGSRSHPAAQFVRFKDSENERLARAARKRGKTIQAFLHDAAMDAIEAFESELGDIERRGRQRADEIVAAGAPTGYGLRKRRGGTPGRYAFEDLDGSSDDAVRSSGAPVAATPTVPPTPPTTQIVIAPSSSAPAVSEIDRLATFVVRGATPPDANARHNIAAGVLAASAANEVERVQLVKALDDRITAIANGGQTNTPTKRPSPIDLVGGLTRWLSST